MSRASERGAVSDILARVTDLPSIPAVALEIVRLTEDEDCTLDDFAIVLSRDPALASKVLRLANSALYNSGSPVSTLQRATMRLGTRAVKLMSLTFSLAGSLPSKGAGPFNFREYWRRSIVCAVASRSLAERLSSPLLDEAFLCGLLARIGQLVLGHCLPETWSDVIREAGNGWPRPEHERKVLGCDGSDIGAALLRSWSLPDLVCDAISCVPDPSRIPERASPNAAPLARIVHSASRFETLFCGGDHDRPLRELVSEWGGHDGMELEAFVGELKPAVEETAQMLDIEIGPVDSEEILAAARQLLVNESLGIASEVHQAHEYAAELEIQNQILSDKANTDALTELPNRAWFDEALARCVNDRRLGRSTGALGLLIADVDRFKSFNDTYGHQTGDAVLKMVASSIRGAMRKGELVARYGGEEFAAILPDISPEGMAAVAERIRSAVESARLDRAGAELSITVSVGGVCDLEIVDSCEIKRLIEGADRHLYEAKRGGRNRCHTAVMSSAQ
ncbi:MAG: HDOD domain-containing protein [Myxococcota bacterium]